MENITKGLRSSVEHTLDALEMLSFNQGFEAAINAIDELSDAAHNNGQTSAAETLRNLAKELRGENV
jgi:soluble cytochrome b562